MLALYGVELAIVPVAVADAEGMTPIAGDETVGVVLGRVEPRRPRAFVTASWRWFPTQQTLLDALAARRSSPPTDANLATVYLEGNGHDGDSGGALRVCRVSSDRPEHVVVGCDCVRDSYAVLLDTWAPGWSVSVDGSPAAIEKADGLVRAVHLEPGAHVLEFSYRTPGLLLGFIVTCGSALACGVALLLARRKQPAR
jgi:hypothetical protein